MKSTSTDFTHGSQQYIVIPKIICAKLGIRLTPLHALGIASFIASASWHSIDPATPDWNEVQFSVKLAFFLHEWNPFIPTRFLHSKCTFAIVLCKLICWLTLLVAGSVAWRHGTRLLTSPQKLSLLDWTIGVGTSKKWVGHPSPAGGPLCCGGPPSRGLTACGPVTIVHSS